MKLSGKPSSRLLEYGELLLQRASFLNFFSLNLYVIFIHVYFDVLGMSIDLLMIWLPMRLRVKVVMSGHARTTMVMCRVIS